MQVGASVRDDAFQHLNTLLELCEPVEQLLMLVLGRAGGAVGVVLHPQLGEPKHENDDYDRYNELERVHSPSPLSVIQIIELSIQLIAARGHVFFYPL
jgi:hypothetical protein